MRLLLSTACAWCAQVAAGIPSPAQQKAVAGPSTPSPVTAEFDEIVVHFTVATCRFCDRPAAVRHVMSCCRAGVNMCTAHSMRAQQLTLLVVATGGDAACDCGTVHEPLRAVGDLFKVVTL